MADPVIIVHGGAWAIPAAEHEAHKRGCLEAAWIGHELLEEGRSSLDAVEEAIRYLEDDPTFDAGTGSFLNSEAEVEMDAMIMDGRALKFGSVAAVQCVRHPITLARKIMELSPHCMLVGAGALEFARSIRMETVTTMELLVDKELERWKRIKGERRFDQRRMFEGDLRRGSHGTVGAVALDLDGSIAAGTSTGGTANKLPGRVGDSPLIGCGTYADNCCGGASATGLGESLMRAMVAREACAGLGQGMGVMEAASMAVARLAERVDGLGGVIVIRPDGEIGHAHNTPFMAVGSVDGRGRRQSFI